jgi:hypothetical protein
MTARVTDQILFVLMIAALIASGPISVVLCR